MNAKTYNKKKHVPLELLAARRANREIERLLHGDGFHASTKIKKSKKVYSRKRKHREDLG